jgi:3-methylfumaryl-CoA hydratase
VSCGLTLEDLGLPGQTTSELPAEHAVRVAATINSDLQPCQGDRLPLLWHWAYFSPTVISADLGLDGHPQLPPGPVSHFPRRMWAAGNLVAKGPLVIGVPATRHSRIVSSKESLGRSGKLLLVVVEHRYRQNDEDTVVEEQTLVYRQDGAASLMPVGSFRPELEAGQWEERQTLDSATLFRFSSVTFNSHRIHYDRPYATLVEGYPALVVHGPLTALLVGESIRRKCGGELVRFEFRAIAPLFAAAPFTIVGTPGTPVVARVVRNDGLEAMRVTAELRS